MRYGICCILYSKFDGIDRCNIVIKLYFVKWGVINIGTINWIIILAFFKLLQELLYDVCRKWTEEQVWQLGRTVGSYSHFLSMRFFKPLVIKLDLILPKTTLFFFMLLSRHRMPTLPYFFNSLVTCYFTFYSIPI